MWKEKVKMREKYHLYNSINHNLEFEVPPGYAQYTKYPENF